MKVFGLGGSEILVLLVPVLFCIWIIQAFLNYGTAYRLTSANGRNGVSLFGWWLGLSLASIIPGLGIYIWKRYRGEKKEESPDADRGDRPDGEQCPHCKSNLNSTDIFCSHCGAK
ncbi:zinc ribbon domain-containing protein, partial [Ellagibacter isourolithinifaciens]|uniref:zinc ribbon domain-containing protein n=1 Tax=Ellagibacter isourolithinifaciens TaxID=2137581 RepID=UPI003A920C01